MGAVPPVKIRYDYEKVYPGTWTAQGVGAQAEPYRRGWYPQLPVLNGQARAFCHILKWLYIGGDFTTVNGQAIPYLCRISLEDGSLDTDFNLGLNGAVNALVTDGLDGGRNLYVGGAFTGLGLAPQNTIDFLAKLDINGNLVNSFGYTAPGAAVLALAYRTGANTIFLGGSFGAAGGELRNNVAEVDTTNGLATAFNAGVFSVGASVNALAYSLTEDRLYIGGSFSTLNGGTARTNAAKLNATTGTAVSWAPDPDGTVNTLELDYPILYMGGDFANAGGSTRAGLAAINQAGTATSWEVNTLALQPNAISLNDTGILFVGGANFALGLDVAVTGASSQIWDANPDDEVTAVMAYKSTVFLGGDFTSVDGIGSTTVSNASAASVPYPLFRDTDTVFVSKSTGAYGDNGTGTYADPKRSLAGCLRTTPTLSQESGGGSDLTQVGFVPLQYEGWTKPFQSNFMAGPFADAEYLVVPGNFGAAWAASNELTVQFAVWIESLAAINTIWDWQNTTGHVILSVGTNGQLNFNIHGTTASSSNGVIMEKQSYLITAEKAVSGNTKRVWVTQPGHDPILVIDTTQVATFGTNTLDVLGRDIANAGRTLRGFLSKAYFFNAAVASNADLPFTWRDRYSSAAIIGAYSFQTAPFLESNADFRYLCILDSETYEDALNLNSTGYSVYANDGCSPTISPYVGAKPGTFGARPGRELNPGTAGTTAFVDKSGSNSTGTLGNSSLPFLTVQAAITATIGGGGSQVVILDSGIYVENINGTGGEVLLQAAEGQTPKIQQSGTGTFITGPFYFLGLILSGNRLASGASRTYAPGAFGSPSSEMWSQDCTFENVYISLAGAAQVYRMENCAVSGYITGTGGGVSFTGTGTVTIRNCYFSNDAVVSVFGGKAFVERCTVRTAVGSAGFAFRSGVQAGNDVANKSTYILYCLAETNGASQRAFWLGRGAANVSSDNKLYNIYGCQAVCNAQGIGFLYQATGTAVLNEDITTAGGTDRNFLKNFASFASCFTEANITSVTGFDTICLSYNLFGSSSADPWMGIVNCLSTGTVYGAFSRVSVETGGDVAGTISKVQNFSAPDSTTYGFWSFDQDAGYEFSGLASNVLFASTAQTATFSTASTSTSFSGAALSTANPSFISTASGSVNAALSASSPCLFNGDTLGTTDQGMNWAWNCNQAPGAIFNGLRFEGSINTGAGLENINGVGTLADFCTFASLGICGALMRDGFNAYACEAAETNGPGFRVGGVSASITRSTAWGCAGTGFLYGAADLVDQHNSSWGCETGHTDTAGAVGSFTDSIHSDNGTDAVANEAIDYSSVGSIGTNTIIGTGTIRLNPLYRDPFTGDLSLQTLEAGYPFQSPCKGTAQDGSDMGAYEGEYGILTDSFIEVSMEDTSTVQPQFTNWRNPSDFIVEQVPIKLSEGDKPLGGSYSRAKAVKRQFTLKWAPDTDMPLDQLICLKQIYANEGQVALSFEGCDFIPCIVMKSNQAVDDAVGGVYSSTDLPRVFDSLVLREL